MFKALQKSSIALVFLTSAGACSSGAPPREPDLAPDKTISYSKKGDTYGEMAFYILEAEEMRRRIRADREFGPEVEFDYRDAQFDDITTPYITERLIEISQGSDLGFNHTKREAFSLLGEKTGVDQPQMIIRDINQKDILPGMAKKGFRIALITYPDTALNAQQWAASWLYTGAENVRVDTGLNDEIIESFIRYHEDGHALLLEEPEADRYASLSILREYGVTDETMRVLQFLSDLRLARSHSAQYVGCYEAIAEQMMRVQSDFTDDVFITGADEDPNHDPLKSLNAKVSFSKHSKYLHDTLFAERIDDEKGFDGLAETRQRALWAMDIAQTNPNSGLYGMGARYEEVLRALDRLESLSITSEKPSAYAQMNPISARYGYEFYGPPTGKPDCDYYRHLNGGRDDDRLPIACSTPK